MAKSKGRRLAEWLRNLDSNSKATKDTIANSSIDSTKLEDDAVTNPKIADGAVHTANIADTGVTFAKLHTALVVTESDAIGNNDNDTTIATSAAIKDYVDTAVAGKDNTDEITEGSTNLYFTNERVDDRVSSLLTAGTGITLTYNDTANTLTVAGSAQYGDSDVGSYLSANGYATQSTIVAAITDSAPVTLDTLNELAAALGDDANFSTTTATSLGNRLRIDTAAQGLTSAQKTNALTNLGITATVAELNYVDGVTSNIQTQLNGKQATGSYLTGNQTITLSGDASGSGTTSIAVTIADDSHNHVISNVDGLQTALDAKLASSSYTASDVLTKIKTVDGSGSGLDADTLDGSHASAFATLTGATFTGDIIANGLEVGTAYGSDSQYLGIKRSAAGSNDYILIQGSSSDAGTTYLSAGSGKNVHIRASANSTTNQLVVTTSGTTIGGNTVWHAGNDGSGSGLDADTVDGVQGSNILTLSGSQTVTGVKTFSSAGGNVFLLNDTNATNATNANIYFYFQAQGSNLGYLGYGTSSNNYLYLSNPNAPIYLAGNSCLVRGGYEVWATDNDGSGSGLDADLWDGQQFSSYLNQALLTTSQPTFNTVNYTNALYAFESSKYIGSDPRWNASGYNANEGCHHFYATTGSASQWGQTGLALYSGAHYNYLTTKSGDYNFYANNSKMWTAGNDGSGSGLDADLWDGQQFSSYLNQAVLTTSGPTFANVYVNDWFRNNAAGEGLYNQATGQHFHSAGSNYWHINSGYGLIFYSAYNGTQGNATNRKGYVYFDGSGFGLLSSDGSWAYRHDNTYADIYGTIRQNGSNAVWHAGNDGSGSGLDADLLGGYASSTWLGKKGNNYYQSDNWIQLNTSAGLYAPSYNNAHWLPNTLSSYATWRSIGSRGGYDGILFDHGGDTALMYDSAGNGGMYQQYGDGWLLYYNVTNNCTGFSTSTTSSSYAIYSNGAIYSTGNITAYSDRRVKENVVLIDSALDKVNKLEGVYYNRIDDEKKTKEIGFIAQDVQEVVPELVTYAEDIDEYGVKYGNATALLVEAVKELTKQVNILKKELEELKNA